MRNSRSQLVRYLVLYFGLVQAIHITAISRSYTLLMKNGEITFLAQPPPGGWSIQARHFLVALGGMDAVNALLALIFVYGYFSRARWWPWLGSFTLMVSVISALVYGYGTMASGAWGGHLGEYLTLVVMFVPIAVLAVYFAIWGLKGWEINEK